MVRSRRRREFRFTEADMRMRAALGDANIIAWYDARFPHTITVVTGVSVWADGRPASPGPSLVQATTTNQPAYSASGRTITFDGSDNFLRVASAAFNTITAAGALVYVGTMPTTTTLESMVAVGTSANAHVMRVARNATSGTLIVQVDTDFVPAPTRTAEAGVRVMHGRREASTGGNVTAGARFGNGDEGTATSAAADQIWNTLTVGANHAATAAAFSDTIARALLVIKGDYSAAQAVAVTEWARQVHGAAA